MERAVLKVVDRPVKRRKTKHSVTFYVPKNSLDFYDRALKCQGPRNVSKYIMGLIREDFQKKGLLDENGVPQEQVLSLLSVDDDALLKEMQRRGL